LFGDNTYLQYVDQPLELGAGERVRASFEFRMPVLARGTYSVSVAVAEGHQADHVVHQWVHEALVLDSHSTSLSTGLIGIPMHGIVLQRLEGGGRPQHAVGEVHS
jgi:lipopolysaccharide transport system ATP-binding protein